MGMDAAGGAGPAFGKETPGEAAERINSSTCEGGTLAEGETYSLHGKKIAFLLMQMGSWSQLCPLEQRLLTSR